MFRSRRRETSGTNSPAALAAADGFLALQSETSQSVEAFPPEVTYSIRHMLTRLAHGTGMPRTMAMVSALRGEGVSYVTYAAATILANDRADPVCIVDLNWWWPNQHLSGTFPANPGVAGVLEQHASLDEVLITSRQKNLAILPAGKLSPPKRPFAARSNGLQEIIIELQERFDHLLLDVPAVLATSDSIPLTALSDGCCLVVLQGVSTKSMIQRAINEIDPVPILGIAMNRVHTKTPKWILHWIPQE